MDGAQNLPKMRVKFSRRRAAGKGMVPALAQTVNIRARYNLPSVWIFCAVN